MAKSKKAFHDRRKRGIGGSDVAKILGLSKWGTAYDVWREKLHVGEATNISTPRTEFGVIMEAEIAKYFALKNGFAYKKEKEQLAHPKYPFLLGHIDGWLVPRKDSKLTERGIAEVKTTSKRVFDSWKGEIPREYYCQVQHYLSIAGAPWAYLIILITETREIKEYFVEYDKEYHEAILKTLKEFWNENVLKNVPPEMTGEDYGKVDETILEPIEADVATATAYSELKEVAEKKAVIVAREDELKNVLKEFMGTREVLTCNNQVIATWKLTKGRKTFNQKMLKANEPEIYEKYVTEGQPSRQFRPKVADETDESD